MQHTCLRVNSLDLQVVFCHSAMWHFAWGDNLSVASYDKQEINSFFMKLIFDCLFSIYLKCKQFDWKV